MANPHDNDYHDLGLNTDLSMWVRSPLGRRQILQLGLAGMGVLLASCSAAQTVDACVSAMPEETAGPFPADGSNASRQQLNVLKRSGIVRSDIRASLNTGNIAEGVPLTVQLQPVNASAGCTPLAGYTIYAWHCSREGSYSMYSNGATDEDYLRGVQETDGEGKATFQTIFPGCYPGRWPHIHFEIYPSLAVATDAANKIHTSQLALPEEVCNTVFNSAEGYSQSVSNLSKITLESDSVFRDGVTKQMATVTGNVTDGYLATLVIGLTV
jgi:protocatechuate 3,4-dioxygenase beta subunit